MAPTFVCAYYASVLESIKEIAFACKTTGTKYIINNIAQYTYIYICINIWFTTTSSPYLLLPCINHSASAINFLIAYISLSSFYTTGLATGWLVGWFFFFVIGSFFYIFERGLVFVQFLGNYIFLYNFVFNGIFFVGVGHLENLYKDWKLSACSGAV